MKDRLCHFQLAFFTACLLAISETATGTLVINEILADNQSTVENAGSYPDYIEIRNNGTSVYDLAGHTLTDDVTIPAKYTFPSGNTLAAGARLIIWCDSDTTAPGLHTGFALSSSGKTVVLKNGATTLDSVTFGPQATDLSIGRVTDGTGTWTANVPTPGLTNIAKTLGTTATLSINEWMASPAYGDDWFELYNSGTAPVALASLYLSDNSTSRTITQIPALSYIGAGSFTNFRANGLAIGGNSCGFKLSAVSGSIFLTAANGTTALTSVSYGIQAADVSQGRFPDGSTTISSFAKTTSEGKANWLESSVVINEVLANPASGGEDMIELYNTGISAVAIGGWWLSDNKAQPKKYQIPAGTSIAAGGYLVFTATQFSSGTVPFGLSSAGDEACLAAVNTSGVLTGYRSQVSFGASAVGVSFGRVAATGLPTDSGGKEFWPLSLVTSGSVNSSPVTTPIIINEIMYHPVDGVGGIDTTSTEFIELHNPTNADVDLSGWRLKKDSDFTFASGTNLPAFGYLVVAFFDPVADPTALATLRSTYGMSNSVQVVGPYTPKLANNTHRLELAYPDTTSGTTAYVNVDKVEYRDISPWPVAADGTGQSLQRLSRSIIGNSSDNWSSATPTPGTLNSGLYTTLAIWSQSPLPVGTVGSAYSFTFVGVGGTPGYTWSLASGTLPTGISLTSGQLTGTPTALGTFNFTIRLTDSLAATTTQAFSLIIPTNDTDNDGIPDAWETANGLTVGIDDSADDADGDGFSNLMEYLAGTDPQSGSSLLAISSVTAPVSDLMTVVWTGVAGKTYQVYSSENLEAWTPHLPTIPCTTDGPLSADITTTGYTALFLRVAVSP
ncbi:MAG: lamin tail domain-containing protein [Akkermansiaceae bacterium]|nr:lamin tail domain-containing protein [Akkermansiaceae bacterium]MDP4646006.1 lamin tail domain-containing protein [Akkermansiaceae bacterium]MDP4721874.1 lamin tail domain-containing protein [Akkermansiaceae bacterium]MDP4780126.1 lamin tail domain-containing protein [Akkermansiaceae bacterium]MDP4848581.1 lamin tail domain-containing protein [Akkermansiaceae bacterium]